jgi:hypothetical protein
MDELATTFPGGAPDRETFDLMKRLSDLQGWCVLMASKDSGGLPAAQLVQDVRAYIVERQYPRARAALQAAGGKKRA